MTTLSTVSSLSAFFSKPSSDSVRKPEEGFDNFIADPKQPEPSGSPFLKPEELSGLPFEQPPVADGLPFERAPFVDGLPFEPAPTVDGLPFEPDAPGDELMATQRLAYLLWSGQIGADGTLPSDKDA